MSDIVKALENLLKIAPLGCGTYDSISTNYHQEKYRHRDECPKCAFVALAKKEAQAALDAVPVLEWKREPAYSPGGTEANGWCERARVGNYSLTVLDDGGWYAVAWSTPLASVGPRTTPEVAKVAAVNWLAKQGVPFRTVRK